MDEQEIRRVYEELLEAMQEQARQEKLLGVSSIALNKSIADMKQKVSASGKSLGDLEKASEAAAEEIKETAQKQKEYREKFKQNSIAVGKNLQSLGGSLAKNDDSFGQLTGTITAFGDLVGGLLSSIPLLGPALDNAAKATAAASTFIIDRLDDTAKAYTQLGSVGATASDGVTGLSRQFNQLGSISLPAFTQAVADNSVGLSAFGSTTAGGAEQLSRALGDLSRDTGPFGNELLRLGFTFNEVAEFGANSIATQTLLGRRQFRTTQDVTNATFEYIKELDLLSRVTGTSRKQQQDEQRKNLADTRFRARLEVLRSQGNEKAAAALDTLATSVGGPAADAIRAFATGIPLSQEAAQANILLQGGLEEVVRKIENGADAQTAMGILLERGYQGAEKFGNLLQYTGDAIGGPATKQILDFAQLYRRALQEGIDPLEAAKKQQEALSKAIDPTTKKFTDAQQNIATASRELQRLGFTLLPEATGAVVGFTSALKSITKTIRDVIDDSDNDSPSAKALQQLNRIPGLGKTFREQGPDAARAIVNANYGGRRQTELLELISTAQARASGGPVNAEQPYLVGEQGPELFIPNAGGQIANADMTNKMAAINQGPRLTQDGAGTATLLGEIKKTFMPGIGEVIQYGSDAFNQTMIKNLDGTVDRINDAIIGGARYTSAQFADGGITAGPSLAGVAGPEAVSPLPDGRSIPIQMPDYSGTLSAEFSNSTGAMMDRFEKTTQQMMNSFKQDANSENKEQLARLDASVTNLQQLVTLMKDQNSATNKLLQVSRN